MDAKFEDLVGKTFIKVEHDKQENELRFYEMEGGVYIQHHDQSCCENVYVEDIAGNLEDLVGSQIILAYESSNSTDKPLNEYDESWTWTFYNIATAKGHVTIRWYGCSNGYYSERVDLYYIKQRLY